MCRITLSQQALCEYRTFVKSGNKAVVNKIAALLDDIAAHPYTGIGKPEALRYELAGKWSRRITSEHCMVYAVNDNEIEVYVFTMKHYYANK